MTQNVTNWVWKNSVSVNASRIVLLAIAHSSDRDGLAEMSVLELATKCRLGERTVQMAVRELTQLGELAVWPRAGAHRRNGYRILTAKGAGSAPINPAGSAPKHGPKGAGSAPTKPRAQNLHPADPAPTDSENQPLTSSDAPMGADSAPMDIDPRSFSTTGISEVDVKDASLEDERGDVSRVCAHLADRIQANGSKRPPVTANWRKSARLMLDRDGRTEQQIIKAIDWCQDSEFWRSNILSMPKLREKYEQLRLQAAATRNGHSGHRPSTTDQRVAAGLDLARKYAAAEPKGIEP